MKDFDANLSVGDSANQWLKKNPLGTQDNESQQDAVEIARLQKEFVKYGRSYPKIPILK